MSLKEAVLAVLEEMDRDADTIKDSSPSTSLLVKGYVKQLRIAIKAVGDTPQQQFSPFLTDQTSASAQHFTMIEKAKEEFRKNNQGQKLLTDFEEKYDPVMRVVKDGPHEGLIVPCDVRMLPGNHTLVEDEVHTLKEDGFLYYG